jgi:uncharacterized membrane protein
VVVRAPNLGRTYWIDEGITVGISSHPLAQLPRLLREDGSPPLFYVLLHFWMRLFGRSAAATHVLPLLISLLAIPVAYWAGRELFDRRAGLAAAALYATNPFLNWYSTETRMYTLVILLAMVGLTLAWRAFDRRRPVDAAGAVVVYALLLYSHDWAIYLTAVTAAVLFGMARARKDRTLAIWVAGCSAACLALWLPWLPTFLYQAGNTAAPWAVRPGIGDFFADPASALAGTVGVVVVPLLVVGVWWNRNRIPDRFRGPVGALAGIALLTTAVGFLGALVEPSWTGRYLAVIVAPYLLAVSGALVGSARGRYFLWAACGVLTMWALIGVFIPNPNGRFAKDNMAAVAAAASSHLAPGDAVIVDQTEQTPVADYYLPAGLQYLTPTGPVADPRVVDWRNIVPRLQHATSCRALGPTLDALPVGAKVLEIVPARRLGASGSAWSQAVNSQVYAVDQFLANDPALHEVTMFTAGLHPRPYAPVAGILYQKTSTAPAC